MGEMMFHNLRLQSKFMIGSTVGIVILMSLVIVTIGHRQSRTLLDQTEKRAVAIAKNIAAVSTTPLLFYNYIALQQNTEKAVGEEDIQYVIICDKERNIAAISGRPPLSGEGLADLTPRPSKENKDMLVETIERLQPAGKKERILDVTVPVRLEDSSVRWGTVRVGLSLDSMHRELFQTRLLLLTIGLVALCFGLGGAMLLSRRITRPIESLVRATMRAARGDLNQKLSFEAGGEFGTLRDSFNRMIENLGRKTDELIEIKRYLDRVIESSPDAITVIDTSNTIVTFNEAAEKLTGYTAGEVLGKSIADFYSHPSDPEKIGHLLFQKGTVRDYETNIVDKDKNLIPISLSLSLICGEDGRPLGSVGISRDLREIKQLQQRLSQSERLAATAKLAATIAHEVSNPIYGIQNCIDLLSDAIDPDNPRRQYLNLAQTEIQRVAALVRQMIDFYRPTAEPFRPVHIQHLLSQIIILEETILKKKEIHVVQNFDPDLPNTIGAENQLKQVFYNIIVNAREAMPNGGQLLLSTRCENQRIRIDISDTGKGISPDDLGHIFEPFFTTKPEVRGVGLGLSVSYGIIQRHRGMIEVKSEMGTGTVFTVTLPIETQAEDSGEDFGAKT